MATTTTPFTLATTPSIPSESVTTAPTTSHDVTPAPDTPKHVHTSLSAGPTAGAVIGLTLVLALIGIGIFNIHMYRRRRERWRQEMEAAHVSPLPQDRMPLGADAGLNIVMNLDPSDITQEKGHHNGSRDSFIPIPNPQVPEPEPTSPPEFPQPESLPTLPNESHPTPTSSTQVQEYVNQDIQVKVVRMEATIGRMAEQISDVPATAQGR
ncbi:hypothetical protein BDP27DRAFT_1437393 [Rhodocollybia butyracea]|uniref:Uncharacterized protein n=1 Tax=Rhodocollybia butyracea TaxID=206335 RepID=A0A9P5TVA8_9AGAR|nr:hypothetical protein BDP27DRAFT_1437393 [Rhodocollybia butyracea]